MTDTQLATIEQALVTGNLAGLDTEQRVTYYLRVCSSLNLNPYTRPFDYLVLNGKLVLYARKDATDQLRKLHRISIVRLEREQLGDLLVVTASATDGAGRTDTAIGAVNVKGLGGEALANALMKAETKSKRRVTLSLCGLGMTDETEVESIPDAVTVEALPKPAAKRERPLEELVERYQQRVEEARALELIPDEDLEQWILPADATRETVIDMGLRIAEVLKLVQLVRVGDPLSDDLATAIEQAQKRDVVWEDCRVPFPASRMQVEHSLRVLQERLNG